MLIHSNDILPEVESSRTSLALASKVKSLALASRQQVLENWPVLGSRTALFFELLKFCEALEKFFGKRFFVKIAWKIFVKTFFFFFGEHLHSCPWSLPWPRAFLSLASRVSVLEKAVLGLGFFCVLGLGLEPCVLDSTSAFYRENRNDRSSNRLQSRDIRVAVIVARKNKSTLNEVGKYLKHNLESNFVNSNYEMIIWFYAIYIQQ